MSRLRIGMISCGKSKLDRPAPARDLYTGPLFRAALTYAAFPGRFHAVYILSAKHCLVQLGDLLSPYDLALTDFRAGGRVIWGERVIASLAHRHSGPADLTILAGAPYADALQFAGRVHFARHDWAVSLPLRGLGQGQRLAWFKRERLAAAAVLP